MSSLGISVVVLFGIPYEMFKPHPFRKDDKFRSLLFWILTWYLIVFWFNYIYIFNCILVVYWKHTGLVVFISVICFQPVLIKVECGINFLISGNMYFWTISSQVLGPSFFPSSILGYQMSFSLCSPRIHTLFTILSKYLVFCR